MMEIVFNKKFLKDLASISSKQRVKIESYVFKDYSNAEDILNSGKLEKLKDYSQFYKIRIGDYRLGIKIEGNIFSYERVLHRKEVYKYFP
ncbi:type II toxin-antitoxin system RelE family toxin [Pedobacter glucosidilyticus]|uniref:type II toxin-antitoxin system RelE family toxin n=1 Tax=Pedobacter glucosidilyticus TaxID=1122941 RepID=UPI0026EA85A2|nr:type II toxin-antitoxin system RelE/ParE family toxin [Pedobacter glucosidilyticus]